ncbi:MAG: protein-tyrosine-phosphatase [Zetaproteobacteria bacterium CG12_big_fil_rev_8_21_14_0_65_54_13]|nr:MAG: protein-tyrosine-phosphatase [Zetaproteobacteria bacterium CG23_combo_of_CG06-09_8_20_14_all_54_7]PIW51063.1 MAG: protein-tyrosine-phosphatase [Zetaproteobacteria bacterium CG12_big_fil_rev_8_21_14_0_65_54_13]PIX54024.1 MAG: protein-tyrosine-phosphatase [Zetaproteobacteria bacterium CG_4_10_14_3_um_filter_54_28]PJA28042.1 MAG: protein-tyrosine-phosphatase [Zetaproteobacteria bacterium CG_4_9_14_3_um_filter_54_145]
MSIRVLFLSRNNATRSQIAEYLLNHMGRGRFVAQSAGSAPSLVNPLAVDVLKAVNIDATGATSKPLTQFQGQSFDFIINICEYSSASCEARKRDCPALPGMESRGCWGFNAATAGDRDALLPQLTVVRDQIATRLRSWMAAVDKVS